MPRNVKQTRITISAQEATNASPVTLSNASVRFRNTTDLANNQPTSQSGGNSLGLLGPNSHQCKGSLSTNPDTNNVALTPFSSIRTKEEENTHDTSGKPPQKTAEKDGKDKAPNALSPLPEDVANPTPYAFRPNTLANLIANNAKDLDALEQMGGADELVRGLGSDRTMGLSTEALAPRGGDKPYDAFSSPLEVRQRIYGTNVLPTCPPKSLLLLMWLALRDKVLILLLIAAAASLALSLYSDFGNKPEPVVCPDTGLKECPEPKVEWVEGAVILIAVMIVVLVGSLNDWQKEGQFRALNDQKDDRTVEVIRNGQETVINIKDMVVGDIALVGPGEILPVDGVFLSGHNIVCDESSATGESHTIKKVTYEDAIGDKKKGIQSKGDCFFISGSKVQEGVGQYIVVAIGPRSFNGRILMDLRSETENTPLQVKLNALAELIAKLGSLAGLIVFTALMIRFFVHLKTDPNGPANTKAVDLVNILIIAVTIIIVAVPEGLPLAFATKRVTKEMLLARGVNASVVCTDKTGTLTTNVMPVVAGSISVHGKFAHDNDNDRRNVGNVEGEPEGNDRHKEDFRGRTVNDAVRKLQISVNIIAVIITFVTAVASSSESSAITAVQLLWINIIMDTFAALALATDPASRDVFDREPDRKPASPFNTVMRMQIIGQSMYQTFIVLLFHFAGDIIFGYDKSTHTELQIQQWHSELNTLVVNAFVFSQVFKSISLTRISSKKNVLAGIHKDFYTIIIISFIEVAVQIFISFVGGAVHHLSAKSWGVSLALGFVSPLLEFLVRLIP